MHIKRDYAMDMILHIGLIIDLMIMIVRVQFVEVVELF